MTKHTPGPWMVVSGTFVYALQDNPDKASIARGHPARINRFSFNVSRDSADTPLAEIQANARLLAAAPDLLQALERIQHSYAVMLTGSPVRDVDEVLSEVDSAIKRAKGED